MKRILTLVLMIISLLNCFAYETWTGVTGYGDDIFFRENGLTFILRRVADSKGNLQFVKPQESRKAIFDYSDDEYSATFGWASDEYLPNKENVVIPNRIVYDGKTFVVDGAMISSAELGISSFSQCRSVKHITFPSHMFPSTMVDMIERDKWTALNNLESIAINSNKLGEVVDNMIVYKPSNIVIYILNRTTEILSIPEGIKNIEYGATIPTSVKTVILPATFEIDKTTISEDNTYVAVSWILSILNESTLENIKVKEGNPYMKDIDGVLFTKDGTEMIKMPIGKHKDKYSYTIPDGVKKFLSAKDLYRTNPFLRTPLAKLTLPQSFEDFNFSINQGVILEEINIAENNTLFVNYDGALYKTDNDGLTLVCVPPCMKHEQPYFEVHDGTTRIATDAIGYPMNFSAVILPNSVEEIEISSFAGFPMLYCNRSTSPILHGYGVLIYGDYYMLGSNCSLYVPEGSKSEYQNYVNIDAHWVKSSSQIMEMDIEEYKQHLVTGIDSPKNYNQQGQYTLYDLSGRRMNHEKQKGVYIKNGKKVVLK